MERNQVTNAAVTGQSQSYIQAATRNVPTPFYRKIAFSIGVLERLQRNPANTYARISIGRGIQLSLKVDQTTDLLPGDLLQLTKAKVNNEEKFAIYGIHRDKVADHEHPLIQGRVKYFDRKMNAWAVKVRSSKKYLLTQPSRLRLLKDQTIFFIPHFRDGQMHIGKIMECEGGVPDGTLPTWEISAPVTKRLRAFGGDLAVVDPYTRTSADIPQLDLKEAAASLPPGSSLQNLPYPQLEEMMIRQRMPANTDWKADAKFHQALGTGLQPLLFIAADEPAKIRKLKSDIAAIQKAGLVRTIRVLYPAPPMLNAQSVKTTMSTQLVNPAFFPITSMCLFDNPGTITANLGDSSKQTCSRLLLIEMLTSGGNPRYQVSVDYKPFQPALLSPDVAARSRMMKCNLLMLPLKSDPRLPILKAHRPPGCRLSSTRHPCRTTNDPILLTFEKENEVNEYLSANRASTRPFFMQSVYDFYSSPSTMMVTTSKMAPPDSWRIPDVDVYPVHQTRYMVHPATPHRDLVAELRALNEERKADGLPALFLEAQGRTGNVVPLVARQSEPSNSDHVSSDSKDDNDSTSPDISLVASGFPVYASEKTIAATIREWITDEKLENFHLDTQMNETVSVVFTSSSPTAANLEGASLQTPLGPISVSRCPTDYNRREQARRKEPNAKSLRALFPPNPTGNDEPPGTQPIADHPHPQGQVFPPSPSDNNQNTPTPTAPTTPATNTPTDNKHHNQHTLQPKQPEPPSPTHHLTDNSSISSNSSRDMSSRPNKRKHSSPTKEENEHKDSNADSPMHISDDENSDMNDDEQHAFDSLLGDSLEDEEHKNGGNGASPESGTPLAVKPATDPSSQTSPFLPLIDTQDVGTQA